MDSSSSSQKLSNSQNKTGRLPILKLENISKSFSGIPILINVSLDLYPGEVHCLVGHNGAGKSTLIKILSGIYKRDSGEIYLRGEPAEINSPAEGLRKGISVIYQEIDLIPDLSVAENISLGQEPIQAGFLRKISRERKLAHEMLERLKEKIPPNEILRRLPIAQQQMVAIAKALASKADIIVMDEPSSALSGKEIETLFRIIRDLKEHGIGIIYISHRIEEIFTIGDRVTVLRDGKRITTFPCKGLDVSVLIRSMVGKEFGHMFPERPSKKSFGETLLEVNDLSLPGKFQHISFGLHAGEILGIAGFVGSGRSELAHALFGREPASSGEIKVLGKSIDITHPRRAIDHKIGMIPEDRKLQGLQLHAPMFENLTFNSLKWLTSWGYVNRRKQMKTARDRMKSFDIQPFQPLKIVQELSGGTQQKVVLANWLFEGLKILIMDEPTRGIDVGTKAEVFRIIRAWADQGVGIILISSEFSELIGMCDRILVIKEGLPMQILDGRTATEETILECIFRGEYEKKRVAMD